MIKNIIYRFFLTNFQLWRQSTLNEISKLFSWLCCQPESKWVQRVIMRVTNVHRQLIHCPEPRPSQLPGESIISEQNISHSLPFRSWKPRRNQSVDLPHVWLHHHRTSRDNHHHAFHQPAHVLHCARTRFCYGQVRAVSVSLSVWCLPDDHDRVVEAAGVDEVGVWILVVDDFCGRIHRIFYCGEDGCTCKKNSILDW